MICVPMFITLTGYLMSDKKINNKYYIGIIKIIVTYILCSIIYLFFSKYYLNDEVGFKTFVLNILSYKGLPNAWYIEMYIGLFILIPFLNIICNNIKNKKHFKLLLFSLLFLISFPGLLNIYEFDTLGWWKQPSIDNNYVKIFPSWWSSFYPLLYYFMGAYLKKYSTESKIKILSNVTILIFVALINGLFSYYRSYNSQFVFGTWNSHDSLFVFIQTFIVFNILLKLKINIKSKKGVKILQLISNSCFGAYLISCVFDYIIYSKIIEKVPIITDRFKYIYVVFIIFILSILSSILIEQIRVFLFYLYNLFSIKLSIFRGKKER